VADVSGPEHLDDDQVDRLEAAWMTEDGRRVLVLDVADDASRGLRTLRDATATTDLGDLALLAGGLVEGGTRATDGGGYTVEGGQVSVFDAGQRTVELSRAAFTRLVLRLLEVAATHPDGVERSPSLAELAAALRAPSPPA